MDQHVTGSNGVAFGRECHLSYQLFRKQENELLEQGYFFCNEDWLPVGRHMTDLPAGEYYMKLKAELDSDGSTGTATYEFTLLDA